MSNIERHTHWENVYQTKGEREVSWFQEIPKISLELIRATGVSVDASIVDFLSRRPKSLGPVSQRKADIETES